MQLLQMGGTQVTLVFPGEMGEYDRETDSYPNQKPDETYAVPFVKDVGFLSVATTRGGLRGVDVDRSGMVNLIGSIVGYIPADEITKRIQPKIHWICISGERYIIEAIEEVKSGKEIATFQIVGKKAA